MRKALTFIVFLLAIIFITFSFSELEEVALILRNSDLRFLFLALAVQVVWAVNEAAGYRAMYRVMGFDESVKRLILLSTAANFINIIAPSGGMGGMAVFVDDAGRRGHPRGMAAAASALHLLLDYVAFLVVLTLGLAVLFRRNELSAGEISASIIMFGLVISFGGLVYIGSRSAQRLGNILAALVRFVNKIAFPFTHKPYLKEERAHDFADEIAEGLSVLHGDMRQLALPAIHALISKILLITILLLTFLDFHSEFSAGTIIAGFAISYLFLVVSPTPSGIGIVEGIMPLALSSLRVPWSQAVIITFAYRAVTFWLPLAAGALAFRLLHFELRR